MMAINKKYNAQVKQNTTEVHEQHVKLLGLRETILQKQNIKGKSAKLSTMLTTTV